MTIDSAEESVSGDRTASGPQPHDPRCRAALLRLVRRQSPLDEVARRRDYVGRLSRDQSQERRRANVDGERPGIVLGQGILDLEQLGLSRVPARLPGNHLCRENGPGVWGTIPLDLRDRRAEVDLQARVAKRR